MTDDPKLSPETEAEIEWATRRYERREKRKLMQARWNRRLGMYIDEIEDASQ